MSEHVVDADFSKFVDRLNKLDDEKRVGEHDLLRVNGIAQNVFYFYEAVRNAVEDKDQTLLRKGAIERYLKRKFRFSRKLEPLAKELIVELTKTRYLENDSIELSEIKVIDDLLADYLSLYQQAEHGLGSKKSEQLFSEIIEMAAYDVDRRLVLRKRDEAYADFVFNSYLKHADFSKVSEHDDKTFAAGLFAAVLRSLYHSDTATIKACLFFATFEDWNKTPAKLSETAAAYVAYSDFIGKALASKLSRGTLTTVRRTIAPYIVLRQLLLKENYQSDYFVDDEGMLYRVKEVCEAQYRKARQALGNSVLRSVLFIFLTKMLLAVLIEIPYDLLISEHLNWLPLGLNLIFPPAYLILVGASTKIPDERNTKKILSDIKLIVYSDSKDSLKYTIRDGSGEGSFMKGFFNFLYATTFAISIALLVLLLNKLDFNIVDSVVFFIFLSTVSFFGFRIGKSAKELVTIDQKRNFTYVLFDFLYTPFIAIGQWLSEKYSKINILTFVLDFIIEAPLKTVLHVFDQWTTFIKDKKDDLV